MGIYINTDIRRYNINSNKWNEIYRESLEIVRYAKFAEYEIRTYNNSSYYVLVPTEDKNGEWNMIGDMIVGSCTENYGLETCERLDKNSFDKSRYNSFVTHDLIELMSFDKGIIEDENDSWDDLWNEYYRGWSELFGSKTQGERPHIYLLAIACLIHDAFPDDCYVHGDITHGQAKRACEIVKKVLDKDIVLPLQYDYKRLSEKLASKFNNKDEEFFFFSELYQGIKDKNYLTYVQNFYGEDIMKNHFVKRFKDKESKDYLTSLIREWLESGFSFKGLCQICKELNLSLEEVCNALAKGQVHLKEKFTYDVTRNVAENEAPDSIATLFARVVGAMTGMRNPAIDAFVPTETIISSLSETYSNDSVESIWNLALEKAENKTEHEKDVEKVYQTVQDKTEEQDKAPKYDIDRSEFLYYWEEGDTIIPSSLNFLIEVAEMAMKNAPKMEKELEDNGYDKIAYVLTRKNYTAPVAERIIANADNDLFRWYLGLNFLVGNTPSANHCIDALRINMGLFDYIFGLAKEKQIQ